MSGVLTWFIEMIVCSGILYANYYALLRNNKFHSYNRYYLLAVVVLSILLPFVHIPLDFSTSQSKPTPIWHTLTAIATVTSSKQVQTVSESIALTFTLKNILVLFYILIASTTLMRFVTALIFIRKLLQKYTPQRTANIYFVNTEEPATPFSFFKWLFWNNKIELQSDNGQQIFRHELFHMQQRHSWDIAFLELTTSVFWINPFFHLIKKEVTTIHEFLADEFATKENDKWSYAELLLIQVLGSSSNCLVNPFFHNQIKRRIAMITSSKTSKYQFFRKLMILPTATFAFILFAFNIKYHSDKGTTQEPGNYHIVGNTSIDPKTVSSELRINPLDTAKPKEKQKTKKTEDQKQIDQSKSESENAQSKELIEKKARESQEGQEMLKKLMAERQKEIGKYQEEFKRMMEMNQREAQENQEKLKLLLQQRQEEAAKYQEEFKRMMEHNEGQAQQEGQEKFKQLMQERQKEAEKFQQQFKEMLMIKQKEVERSQQELKKLLEDRQQQMQKFQEDFKKMMLMQQEKARTKKLVI